MKRKFLYIILFMLIFSGSYCGYRYYSDVIQPKQQIATENEKQNQIFERVKPHITVDGTSDNDEPLSVIIGSENKEKNASTSDNDETLLETELLAPAKEVNESTNAWLTIPDTNIDYPVVQGEDNDFYLHHGINGQYNNSSLLLLSTCTFEFSDARGVLVGVIE